MDGRMDGWIEMLLFVLSYCDAGCQPSHPGGDRRRPSIPHPSTSSSSLDLDICRWVWQLMWNEIIVHVSCFWSSKMWGRLLRFTVQQEHSLHILLLGGWEELRRRRIRSTCIEFEDKKIPLMLGSDGGGGGGWWWSWGWDEESTLIYSPPPTIHPSATFASVLYVAHPLQNHSISAAAANATTAAVVDGTGIRTRTEAEGGWIENGCCSIRCSTTRLHVFLVFLFSRAYLSYPNSGVVASEAFAGFSVLVRPNDFWRRRNYRYYLECGVI